MKTLDVSRTFLWVLLAAVCSHAAYLYPSLSLLILGYLFALAQLARARVAPVRAAEYEIPIFRVASSGVSQWVDSRGRVSDEAPFPGELACLRGPLVSSDTGHLPWDRGLAPFSTSVTVVLCLGFLVRYFLGGASSASPLHPKRGRRVAPPSDWVAQMETLL